MCQLACQGSRDSQCERHVLLHPLQSVQQSGRSVASVVVLLLSSAAHRQHILVVKVVELRGHFVVTLTGTLCLPACVWIRSRKGEESEMLVSGFRCTAIN